MICLPDKCECCTHRGYKVMSDPPTLDSENQKTTTSEQYTCINNAVNTRDLDTCNIKLNNI